MSFEQWMEFYLIPIVIVGIPLALLFLYCHIHDLLHHVPKDSYPKRMDKPDPKDNWRPINTKPNKDHANTQEFNDP